MLYGDFQGQICIDGEVVQIKGIKLDVESKRRRRGVLLRGGVEKVLDILGDREGDIQKEQYVRVWGWV